MLATDQTTTVAAALRGVRKIYRTRSQQVTALDGVTLTFPVGTFTAVMGPSGSGKSTLLQCAAGLDSPTEGTVEIAGILVNALNETQRTLLRRASRGAMPKKSASNSAAPEMNPPQRVVMRPGAAGSGS